MTKSIKPRRSNFKLEKVENRTSSMRWFSHLVEVTDHYLNSPVNQALFVKSAARKVVRDYNNSLPLEKLQVVEICQIDVAGTTCNESGDNVFITFIYNEQGHCTSFGGHFDLETKHMVWSCYAD